MEVIKLVHDPTRVAYFRMGVIGLGCSAAPIFLFLDPSTVLTSLGMTTAIFGGASVAAYSTPNNCMLKWRTALAGSLFGLITLQTLGISALFFVGPNLFSTMALHYSNYITAGLFTFMIWYDTQVAIKMYERGEADHLGVAHSLLLDFWNIFLAIINYKS